MHEPARVLIAPNAFKGSLTALQAANAMATGVRAAIDEPEVRLIPIADGGDGSVDCLVSVGFARQRFTARGPTARPVIASLALRDRTAVVEVANTCGMVLLPDGVLEPLASTTHGLGDAIVAALDLDADEIVVCLGGSASTDGGTGMLAALGVTFADAEDRAVVASGATLGAISRMDLSGMDPRVARTRFVMAADVDVVVTGDHGAARMFGPQKGADPAMVDRLDRALENWGSVLREATGRAVADEPGAGAAGGAGAAVLGVLAAARVPGSEYLMSELGVAAAMQWADLVVTGEGRLDEQSARGKGALAVVELARDASVASVVVCGSVDIADDDLRPLGVVATGSLLAEADGEDDAIRRAGQLLATATEHAVLSADYFPRSTRRA